MKPVVEIRGLSKRFGRTTALDGLDLVVEAGLTLGAAGLAALGMVGLRRRDLALG
jgi:ABC-type multidrug transport system ATPase subunit